MQRANKRKFHYIYKITRDDGRFYIGMHSTDNLDDGYFGSGKLITRSIKKHGIERHTKEILKFVDSREELKKREQELVTEELICDKLCMNLKLGGIGGFSSKIATDAWKKIEYATKVKNGLRKWAEENKEASSVRAKKAAKTRIEKGQQPFAGIRGSGFKNKKHT